MTTENVAFVKRFKQTGQHNSKIFLKNERKNKVF